MMSKEIAKKKNYEIMFAWNLLEQKRKLINYELKETKA